MENITLLTVIGIILWFSIRYIIKAKKKGVQCIGCVHSGTCGSCSGCSGHTSLMDVEE